MIGAINDSYNDVTIRNIIDIKNTFEQLLINALKLRLSFFKIDLIKIIDNLIE